MSRTRGFLMLSIAAFAAAGIALANRNPPSVSKAEAPATSDRQADRDAIKAMVAQFKEAFQKGDAAAAVAFLTAEAELVPDDGTALKGRDAIQKAYAAHFEKKERLTIAMKPEKLRFTSRDTAFEDGEMTVTTAEGSSETHPYHILYVREDGKWFISVVKEWPSESSGLDGLAWLIGTWSAKSGDVEVMNTYEWFGSKAFIKATISVRGKNRAFTAMQIIGVDPTTGVTRTWTFEHDGGLGEGTVMQDGPRWIFENMATLGTDSVLETTNILVPVDRDTITWQPVNLAVDGETLGNLPPTKLARVKK